MLSPGVVVHELAHFLFCVLTETKVYEVKIFQFSEVAGYVKHKEVTNIFAAFFVSFGPLFLNTLISFLLFKKFNLNW